MTSEEKAQLRSLLAEQIPVGGTASDTLFSEAELEAIFDAADGNVSSAAQGGWRQKAAHYAELVDISEAGEQLRLSQLHANALKMVEYYDEAASGKTSGSRNHPLSRTYRR